ncbi:PQQ-dependent sugar dehydrogenase [Bacillus songklensis]|uniref:PQQ-dependent sugar dehydrogenase n=1 Tax=Bacillus songklensis TaxID=1069116 RepID=A0ABV8B6H4_9BACI
MKILSIGMALLFLSGCTWSQKETESPPASHKNHSGRETAHVMTTEPETLIEKLDIPWSITKHHNVMYISQRKGPIVKFDEETRAVDIQKIKLAKSLHLEGEGGFLGFVLSPDFPDKPQAFAYYTFKEGNTIYNRVVLMEQTGNQWVEKKELISNIPGAKLHNGGRMKIGPDGKLYVTTGDALSPDSAQDRSSLGGKILRMNLDGSIPNDNPFPQSYIYSYGHRNPQGLAWDEQGTLYSSEHGQSAHDEINKIEPGQNYGWPVIQGDKTAKGMKTPLFHSGDVTWAPAGMDYHQGTLYVAALAGSRIMAFDLQKKTIETVFDNGGRMRDSFIDKDQLYFISNNRDGRGTPAENDDRLYRLPLKN